MIRVTDGSLVEFEPSADRTPEALRLMLMGWGAALVLHQRGALPLHGSAVLTDRGAVLVLGHSGVGKSTTLGALMELGQPALCDDLAPVRLVDGVPVVWPGSRVMKLWANSADSLGWSVEGLPAMLPDVQKYVAPLMLRATEPAPLVAAYRLAPHAGDAIDIRLLRGADAVNAVLDHVWVKRAAARGGLQGQQFLLASSVAAAVPVLDVRRPDGGAIEATELAERLLADLRERCP